LVPIALKNSRKIITVSEYEKKIIRNFFSWPDDGHLKAVYNGVNDYFKPIYDDQILSDVKKKYQLPDHYFFFLGNTDPKKNTKNVLKAYASYIKRNGSSHKLVIVDYDQEALALLMNEIGTPELINQIHLTGYVVNSDLPAIYNQSDLFLYPSLRESFGIPILEAMACGIPVITSTTSSMPEVAGEAALLVDPYIPDEITLAIEQMISDPILRQRLRMAGFKQASQFSWPKMAADVLEIYKEVINDKTNQ
jgi:glycosyltransferase involved in cell wall biosynthesis